MASSHTESWLAALARRTTSSSLYQSLFRHGYADSARNRALEVTSNGELLVDTDIVYGPERFNVDGAFIEL